MAKIGDLQLLNIALCNVPSLHAMHQGFVTPIGLSISFRYSEGAKSQRINSCRPLIPTPQALPHYLGTTGYIGFGSLSWSYATAESTSWE